MGLKSNIKPLFRFADLFAGLGGFHQAAAALGGSCVFASELEPDLRDLYELNFKIKPHGDIRSVSIADIPDHEVLFAGFPCQPFSKAGKQLGWKDAVRGTLFENIVAIASEKKPRVLLMENVAHFVRHDAGHTYEKVQAALEAVGYQVAYHQYSPHQFSVPHIRERIYMVAARTSLAHFNWPEEDERINADVLSVLDTNPLDAVKVSKRVSDCLDAWQEFLNKIPSTTKLPSFPIWSMEAGATYPITRRNLASFTAKELGKYRGAFGVSLAGLCKGEQLKLVPPYARGDKEVFPEWKRTFIRQNRQFFNENEMRLQSWLMRIRQFPASLQKFEWNCQGETRKIENLIVQFRASGVRVKRRTTAPSLVAMTTSQIPIIPWEGRYMTVRERARLQSMDNLRHLPIGSKAMAALGNAVNVTVVSKIMRSVLESGLLTDD